MNTPPNAVKSHGFMSDTPLQTCEAVDLFVNSLFLSNSDKNFSEKGAFQKFKKSHAKQTV
jgi:hypothetical protein